MHIGTIDIEKPLRLAHMEDVTNQVFALQNSMRTLSNEIVEQSSKALEIRQEKAKRAPRKFSKVNPSTMQILSDIPSDLVYCHLKPGFGVLGNS